MIRKIIVLLFSLASLSGLLVAQELKTDSIQKVLESAAADTNKVNMLIDLGKKWYRSSPKEALGYSKEAIEIAQKLGYGKGLALAYKNAGLSHYVNGEYAETINYWQLSRQAFESFGDRAGVANILSNMGAVYNNFGKDTKALELYFESQKVAEEIKDSLRIVTTMINIGTIYVKKPVTVQKAIDIYLAALPVAEALRDNDAIGTTTANLGEAYFKSGDYSAAITYYKKSLLAFEKSSSGNLSFSLTSIGNVYAKQGDFSLALQNQSRALEISKGLNAKPDMVSALLGLAGTYSLKGDIPQAIESFDQAQALAREISANFELRDAYEGLAKMHASTSDYRNAYKYQVLLTDIREVLYLSSNDNLIKQQQLGFDLVKKQGELEVQKLAMEKQKIVKNAFLAGLILIVIIAIIILRNYLNKVKVNRILDKQKAQIENLLLNILPAEVAKELQDHGAATPRDYQSVSVLFTDFKDFTKIAEGLHPNDLVTELNEYFQEFDSIVERNNLEKIKTIGDSYMCAGGIPTENSTHPVNVVMAGLEMQEFMRAKNTGRIEKGLLPWGLRVGIHTGPLVAGVVGRKKYAYDIWGNTVNIASRMESNGDIGKVNISAATFELIRNDFNCTYRGKISAKNVGEIDMYFVDNLILLKN
jgi:class 3 adenylate cyclase/tetratricopeptide (TPR) repeat protein